MVLPGGALALKHQNAALGVVLRALLKGGLHDSAGRQPRLSIVVEIGIKLLANATARLNEALVFELLGLDGVRRNRVIPVGVQATDDGAESEGALAEALLKAGGGDGLGVIDGNAVVVGIQGLDEALVQLVVQQLNFCAVLGDGLLRSLAELLGDDGLAKVHEDEAGTRQLGVLAREGGGEAALVMVVALLAVVVLTANIDNGVAGLEQLGIASADQLGVVVGGQLAQHVHSQGLIGVEVAIVGADGNGRHLESLCCVFGHS
ncbi:hypothetical protein CI238_02633 [Colletotrichum incanum]|uniref:Uncharacterized protein n=1 Tax=Colletotrichum incanum TaxID=1573173 RepID=A0A162NZF2_COLIC|nr:hypothetical protein CI238_02633 [Colletotrichum incanum]